MATDAVHLITYTVCQCPPMLQKPVRAETCAGCKARRTQGHVCVAPNACVSLCLFISTIPPMMAKLPCLPEGPGLHTTPRSPGTPRRHTVSPSQSEWIFSQSLPSCGCLGDQECLPQEAHPGSASHQGSPTLHPPPPHVIIWAQKKRPWTGWSLLSAGGWGAVLGHSGPQVE